MHSITGRPPSPPNLPHLLTALTLQLLLSSQDMRDDVNLLSMTAKEAARQVAAHCVERARVMLKVHAFFVSAAFQNGCFVPAALK